MGVPEGFIRYGQSMSPEQIQASKEIALQRAIKEHGLVVNLVEGYGYVADEEGHLYVGPAYMPQQPQSNESAVSGSEAYWGIQNRRNLCDEEYIGPRDIM